MTWSLLFSLLLILCITDMLMSTNTLKYSKSAMDMFFREKWNNFSFFWKARAVVVFYKIKSLSTMFSTYHGNLRFQCIIMWVVFMTAHQRKSTKMWFTWNWSCARQKMKDKEVYDESMLSWKIDSFVFVHKGIMVFLLKYFLLTHSRVFCFLSQSVL